MDKLIVLNSRIIELKIGIKQGLSEDSLASLFSVLEIDEISKLRKDIILLKYIIIRVMGLDLEPQHAFGTLQSNSLYSDMMLLAKLTTILSKTGVLHGSVVKCLAHN